MEQTSRIIKIFSNQINMLITKKFYNNILHINSFPLLLKNSLNSHLTIFGHSNYYILFSGNKTMYELYDNCKSCYGLLSLKLRLKKKWKHIFMNIGKFIEFELKTIDMGYIFTCLCVIWHCVKETNDKFRNVIEIKGATHTVLVC